MMGTARGSEKMTEITSEKTTTKIENEQARFFHAWKCEISDQRHRPNGRRQEEGCGRWSVYASKHPEADGSLMATCRRGCLGNGGKGPRKVRLNASTRPVYTFEGKEAAKTFCEAMNNQQEALE